MNKKMITSMLLVLLAMVGVVSAAPLPVAVNSVEVDDQLVTLGSTNRLSIERDQPFEVKVVLTATEALSNVEVEAFVSGYEYNDVERVFDATPVFDVQPNTTYTKRLTIVLPADADADNYKLRVVIADRDHDAIIQNYELRLDAQRHLLRVDDVNLFSAGHGNQVVSGDPLLANVRVKNLGDRTEDDVKVRVSLPALGVSGTRYIDSIRSDKSEETGNLYLKLPKCVDAGDYGVTVEVTYDNGKRLVNDRSQTVSVLKNDACDKKEEPQKVIVEVIQQTPPAQPPQQTVDNSGDSSLSKIRSALEIFLVVLFAIFIVIGIVVFFSRLMRNPEDDE
ncbi:hypothetical protein HY484_04460 [Candidatus Woesearchaeota archaeon]|nr:hypothetical protein [Candidatus Woesearchaeota archaeon]